MAEAANFAQALSQLDHQELWPRLPFLGAVADGGGGGRRQQPRHERTHAPDAQTIQPTLVNGVVIKQFPTMCVVTISL